MKPKFGFRRELKSLALSIPLAGAIAIAPDAFAASATWDGGPDGTGTDMNTATNWSGDVLPTASGDTATWDGTVAGNLVLNWNSGFGSTPEATSYVLTSTQTGNLTLDATGNFDLAMNSITIASGAGAFTLGDGVGAVGSSGRIVFRGDLAGESPQNAAYKNNVFTNDSSNTATWGADLNFGATGGGARNLVFGGTGNWTINSNLSGIGIQLTKNGAGTLSLTNINSTLDIVAINSGTLKVEGAGQLREGNFSGTFINNGTFDYSSSALQTIGSSISGTGALIKSGASILTLTGNNSYSGDTTIDAGTLRIGGGGQLGAGNYAGNISIASGAVFEHASTASTTLGGAVNRITGLGSITKSGTGTLRINSSQSFSGGVNLTGGILEYDGAGALGTGTITVSAGEITGRGSGGTLANNVVLNGDVQLGRNGVGSGMGFTGNFDLGGGVRTLTTNGVQIVISGIISNGGLIKSGTSSLQLSNTGNTYSAGTVINAGALEYTGAGALGTGTITINGGELTARGAGGTLANNILINGNFQLGRDGVGSFIGLSGSIDLGGGTRTITTPGADATIGGVISNGGLTKAGNSKITLTATNTYTGATTVSGGTLVVNGNISTSSLTTVQTGATLGGNGTVGALIVQSGGFLAPGNSPGILSTGNLDLQSGATLNIEINGNVPGSGYDQVNITGSATLAGMLNVALGFTPANGDLFFILLNDGDDAVSGTFSGLANNATFNVGDQEFQISYFGDSGSSSFTGGNDVVLMAIPEPGSALIGSVGFLMLLNRRRRR